MTFGGFEVGRTYNRRRDIHGKYGGQMQGGICTPKDHPLVLAFTGASGQQHGYADSWTPEGVYRYFGEGQSGDMTWKGGTSSQRPSSPAVDLVSGEATLEGADKAASELLILAGHYRHIALAAYTQARPLYERSLAIREKTFGPEYPDTAEALNDLALLLKDQGDLAGARPLYERALAIDEKMLGPEHPSTATKLNNLALLLKSQGDFVGGTVLV